MQSPGQYGVNEVPQFLLGMRQHPPGPHQLFSLSHDSSLSPSSAHSHPSHQQQHIYYHHHQQQQLQLQQQKEQQQHQHQLHASHSPHQQQHQHAQHQQHQQQLQQQQQMVQQLGLGGGGGGPVPDSPEAATAGAPSPGPVATRPLAASFSKQLTRAAAGAVSARDLVLGHEPAPLLHITTTATDVVDDDDDDDDPALLGTELAAAAAGGDDGGGRSTPPLGDGSSAAAGNRWPRQETLVLIKIRSKMDASFRDSGLKGPLWEEVARRLAEFGYNRSAKKCKEKFENIHKYYKKTKSGQAGRRQDGKNYRFFSELDALYGGDHHQHRNKAVDHHHHHHHHAGAAVAILQSTQSAGGGSGLQQAAGIADHAVGLFRAAVENHATSTAAAAADSDSSEDNYDHGPQLGRESDLLDDDDDGGGGGGGGDAQRSKKRKLMMRHQQQQQQCAGGVGRPHRSNNSISRKVLFFESLMKKLMDKQDAMQRKFLESIERREQERLVREEAWKRQEMAHLARDHELRIQQHNLAVSRDAALVAALQKVTGHTLQLPQLPPPPPPPALPLSPLAPPPPLPPSPFQVVPNTHVPQPSPAHQTQHHKQQQQQQLHQEDEPENLDHHASSFDLHSSKRWPTPEVHALIRLRSSMEPRFQETGPKGPLWEEISTGMSCLGYVRNAKRCKEKWENVNKYFRKIKESSKKRPENSKTCPYFHQLDTLYHNGTLGTSSPSMSKQQPGSKQVDDEQQQSQGDHHLLQQLPDHHHQQHGSGDNCRKDDDDNDDDEDDPTGGLVVHREAGIIVGMQQQQLPAAGDGVAIAGGPPGSTSNGTTAIHFFSNTENGSNGGTDHGGVTKVKL